MKKNFLLGTGVLLTLFIFSGCGSSSSSTTAPPKVSSDACMKAYFNDTVSVTLNACVSCHSTVGEAKGTRFILQSPLTNNKSANYAIVKSFIKATGSLIIDKGTNSVQHAGRAAMTSSAKATMQTFIDYVQGSKTCVTATTGGSVSSKSVSLLTPNQTLRAAALKLSGSAPTQSALDSTSSLSTLDTQLNEYMKSDYFYDWLALRFNDFLLTDFYSPGRNAEDLLNSNDFPGKRWYEEYWTKSKTDQPNMFNDNERYHMYRDVNYAIAREPINLMLHVIKEDRPFSEILTADYVLVNPYSARTYGIDINGFTFSNDDLNLSIEDIEAKYPKDSLKEAQIDGIPHAGLFTTITYLNRFPSTNTNLDRKRSAKAQLFFFDTDILALANRPIKALDVIGNSATWTNPNCTVCHNVMEPIAGAFSNWDNNGRYRPGWRTELAAFSQEPGLSIENKTPPSASNNILQWLSKEMVKDDRFAMASVKIFFKAILGREALKKPQTGDIDYTKALEAYNFEHNILLEIQKKFQASNMNAKVIIKELIKSPLYRANALKVDNPVLSKVLGQAHLITPEALDQKIYDAVGYYWNRYGSYYSQKDNNRTDLHRLLRSSGYKTLYGGINSGSISTRVTELNGVMANIQLRMATQMGCFPTTRDFFFPMKERKLFPYVTKTQEPITEGSINDIKKNIQYLHKHILGEDLGLNDPEIDATYKLFYDTYMEGKERVYNSTEDRRLLTECRMYYDPHTFKRLDSIDEITYDDHYVIRAWSAVITYLLSDFKFLYETSGE